MLAARPKTLAGAAVPVMIGVSLSVSDSLFYPAGAFSPLAAALCFLFAFLMQIDANFVNDLFDYAKGNDDAGKRLGPRRACAQGWVSIGAMKRAIALTTCAAAAAGLPLVHYGGMEMIAVGVLCIVFCFLYTTHLSYLGMGDLLVIVFFGIVPVCVTYYVQLHTVTTEVFWASVASGLVIDTLLLINNYRDRDNDRDAGKRTLVVRCGAKAGETLYLVTGCAACMIGIIFVFHWHVLAFIMPLTYLFLHVEAYKRMRAISHGKALNLCLGETSRNMLVYGLTVSLGLLLS